MNAANATYNIFLARPAPRVPDRPASNVCRALAFKGSLIVGTAELVSLSSFLQSSYYEAERERGRERGLCRQLCSLDMQGVDMENVGLRLVLGLIGVS